MTYDTSRNKVDRSSLVLVCIISRENQLQFLKSAVTFFHPWKGEVGGYEVEFSSCHVNWGKEGRNEGSASSESPPWCTVRKIIKKLYIDRNCKLYTNFGLGLSLHAFLWKIGRFIAEINVTNKLKSCLYLKFFEKFLRDLRTIFTSNVCNFPKKTVSFLFSSESYNSVRNINYIRIYFSYKNDRWYNFNILILIIALLQNRKSVSKQKNCN